MRDLVGAGGCQPLRPAILKADDNFSADYSLLFSFECFPLYVLKMDHSFARDVAGELDDLDRHRFGDHRPSRGQDHPRRTGHWPAPDRRMLESIVHVN